MKAGCHPALLPWRQKQGEFTLKIRRKTTAAVLALLLGLAGCDRVQRAQEFVDGQMALRDKSHIQLISREMALTTAVQAYPRQLRALADQGHPINADPELLEWSQNIAVALIQQAERMYPHSQGWDWDLAVVGTGELNAWCMAGGKMALYTGLVDATQGNPHKVAAVLGHEIAHALLEHTRTGMSREALLSSSLWIASKSFKIGTGRMNAIAQDLHLGLKSMDRDAEREADALGLELMARAGFDPVEGARVWLDFQRGEMGTGAKRLVGFLGDHPLDEERLQTLQALAEKLKRTEAPAKASKKGAQS
ncbi:MAG: M48 family peptidase [Rhodoferax sp.]|nr:MAG: M48 family peptidase [Rhodoferax sp.]